MYIRRLSRPQIEAPAAGQLAHHGERYAQSINPAWMLVFVLAHIPLALLMQFGTSVVTIVHAGMTVALGLKWAADGQRLDRVAILAGYITGCEVLWRMTNDRLFWETGKYAVVLILATAIVRSRGLRVAWVPIAYFLLLLPSSFLTLSELGLDDGGDQLSFNLSGPLALMVAACFFWGLELSAQNRRILVLATVAPIVGIAAIALVNIILTPDITFTTESNIESSGGFGPNQVSAILGLGALLFWFLAQDRGLPAWHRSLLFVGLAWLAVQSALTFSRGGIYAAVGGAALGLPYLLRDRQLRLRLFAIPALLYVVWLLVWPQLDRFTNGQITARFQETELTKRGEISQSDFDIWSRNRVLGVGPGISKLERLDQRATHTEFTRLVSEHGSFGALALAVLFVGAARHLIRRGPAGHMSLTASMMGWSALYMANSAMRLVAPAFAFGLVFSSWAASDVDDHATDFEAEPTDPAPRRRVLVGSRGHVRL